MICAMYLRKSRADMEAEARGEGETLSRHKETLLRVAVNRGLTVTDVYSELVSGDTIAERPEMQRLLRAVERGDYDAVLCMDIDRLGRGDGADQAAILKTFKYSDTIIITPYKDYNTRREMDEEFLEYSQFIARSEYKRIKRRMWAGRVASAKEGKWQSPRAPFGYRRVRLDDARGWTLTPDPSEADAVRSVYAWYASGECGQTTIANRLTDMGFRTLSGKPFTRSAVRGLLSNPVYIGMVRWSYRRKHVDMQNGKEVVTRPKSEECIISPGLHPAVIDRSLWDAVQSRLATHSDPHTRYSAETVNPLAGLMRCGECGHMMVLTPEYNRRKVAASYKCTQRGCPTARIDARCVYDSLLHTLRAWSAYGRMAQEQPEARQPPTNQTAINAITAQLAQLKAQLARLQDLLETGVYTPETYLERSKILEGRIACAAAELSKLQKAQSISDEAAIIRLRPKIDHLLDVWDESSPEQKNRLLRALVRRIDYHKLKRCTRKDNPADYLTLELFPIVD